MKCLKLSVFLIFLSGFIYSQDTLREIEIQKIINSIENGLDEDNQDIPYEILENLQDLLRKPININSCSDDELYELPFLSSYQVNELISYKNEYGNLLSFGELIAVPGFSLPLVKTIMPFVCLHQEMQPSGASIKLKTNVFLRYARSLYFENKYLGSPEKILIKARQESRIGINWGLIADKDAGEVLFSNIPDTIREQIKNTSFYGFDFYSGYIEYNSNKFLKKIILGDFQLTAGQGLSIWSSGYFSDPSNPIQGIRFGRGIRPNTSSYESGYFRGGGISTRWGKLRVSVFYSNRFQDGLIKEENGFNYFSSFRNSGYHRTINELNSKNTIKIEQYGGCAEVHLARGIIGCSLLQNHLSCNFVKEDTHENILADNYRDFINSSIYWNYTLINNLVSYGELAFTKEKTTAIIAGLYAVPKPYFDIGLSFRYFSEEYFSISANASRNGNQIPERSVRLCTSIDPIKKLEITAFIEHIHFGWLRQRLSKPGNNINLRFNLTYDIHPEYYLLLSYAYKEYEQNINSPAAYMDPVMNHNKYIAKFSLFYNITASVNCKSQFIFNNISSQNSKGNAFSQELNFDINSMNSRITASFIGFNTDNYDSRIYVYEKNVLHAFSFPSYSGSGMGAFFLIRSEIGRHLTLWLRISKTKYFRNSTSTESWKKDKGEISLQIRMKL